MLPHSMERWVMSSSLDGIMTHEDRRCIRSLLCTKTSKMKESTDLSMTNVFQYGYGKSASFVRRLQNEIVKLQ